MSLTRVMPVNEEERILSLSIWKGNYTYEFALCITTSEMLKKVNKFEVLGPRRIFLKNIKIFCKNKEKL